jgi:serine protease inhibitor
MNWQRTHLKKNQKKVPSHYNGDHVKRNIIFTKDLLIDKYTEILDLKKFEKLKDRMVLSPPQEL